MPPPRCLPPSPLPLASPTQCPLRLTSSVWPGPDWLGTCLCNLPYDCSAASTTPPLSISSCFSCLSSSLCRFSLVLSLMILFMLWARACVCDNWIIYFRGLAANKVVKIVGFSLSIKLVDHRHIVAGGKLQLLLLLLLMLLLPARLLLWLPLQLMKSSIALCLRQFDFGPKHFKLKSLLRRHTPQTPIGSTCRSRFFSNVCWF